MNSEEYDEEISLLNTKKIPFADRVILDATVDFNLYEQRFREYQKTFFFNKYECYFNNYKQLVIQIFDQFAIDVNLALGVPQLNMEYFVTPTDNKDFIENIYQAKMEIALTIFTNLKRHSLLDNTLLKDYYLYETNNIVHVLAPTVLVVRKG